MSEDMIKEKASEIINIKNILTSIVLLIFQFQLTNITTKMDTIFEKTNANGISIVQTATTVNSIQKRVDNSIDEIGENSTQNTTNNIRISNLELRLALIEQTNK